MSRLKPQLWNWTPARIAPAFRSMLRGGVLMGLPFAESMRTIRGETIDRNGKLASALNIGRGDAGRGLLVDNSSFVQYSPRLYQTPSVDAVNDHVKISGGAWTHIFAGFLNGSGGLEGMPSYYHSGNAAWGFGFLTKANTLRAKMYVHPTSYEITGPATTSDQSVLAIARWHPDDTTLRASFFNIPTGELLNAGTVDSTAKQWATPNYFCIGDGQLSGRQWNGVHYYSFTLPRFLADSEVETLRRHPFGLIRKELWTPDLAPSGGASGNGSFAVTHTHSTAFTASEGEASSFAVSHTHTVAFTASGDTSGSFAVSHTHSVYFVAGQDSLRATLAAALATEAVTLGLTPVAVLDHPRPPPGTPCIMVAPGSPWLVNNGPAGYQVRFDVVVYAARLDVASAWDTLEQWVNVVRNAAPAAEMRHESTEILVESASGVDYVVARSTVAGETRDP